MELRWVVTVRKLHLLCAILVLQDLYQSCHFLLVLMHNQEINAELGGQGAEPLAGGAKGTLPGGQVIPRISSLFIHYALKLAELTIDYSFSIMLLSIQE